MFKLYNEKIISVAEVKPGRILKVSSLDVPKWNEGPGKYAMGPYKFFSDTIVIKEVAKRNVYCQVDYEVFGVGYGLSISVPLDFVFQVLDNEEELKREHQEKKEKAIENQLAHSSQSGSDPEIFVEDKNGIVIPAFLFLGAKPVPDPKKAYSEESVYWDGFQAEFTTHSAGCLSAHIDSVQRGLSNVLRAARKFDGNSKLSIKTVMDIPQDLMDGAKPEHVNFGCMPSLNSYKMQGRNIPGREVSFRPAGGHIHMGVSPRPAEKFAEIVKAMDAILGVACVSLFASFDDPRRRQLYGLAGEHRLPKHGLEYRVLSNAWLIHPFLMNIVFDLARKSFVFGDKNFMKLWKADEAETIETINNCDVVNARKILVRNEEVLLKIFESIYVYPYAAPRAIGYGTITKEHMKEILAIWMNGLEFVIKDPTNIEGNWKLSSKWEGHANADKEDMQSLLPEIRKGNKAA